MSYQTEEYNKPKNINETERTTSLDGREENILYWEGEGEEFVGNV